MLRVIIAVYARSLKTKLMVLKLDGKSEIGASVWNEGDDLICLRQWFKSTAVTKFEFYFQKIPVLTYHLILEP